MSALTATRPVDTHAWLTAAAARLDREGSHALATKARDEAAALLIPQPTPVSVVMQCDSCRKPVGKRQTARFVAVDWTLCSRCQH